MNVETSLEPIAELRPIVATPTEKARAPRRGDHCLPQLRCERLG